jgi:hypothetical protein
VARGKRAPRAPSIVDVFFRLPSPEFAVGTLAPDGCHLALVAAQAPLVAMREAAQSGNKLAATPDGRAGVSTAETSPRYDEPALLLRDEPSDSPVQ